jgi:hypothetical protein
MVGDMAGGVVGAVVGAAVGAGIAGAHPARIMVSAVTSAKNRYGARLMRFLLLLKKEGWITGIPPPVR